MMKVAVPQRFKLRVVPDVKTLIFGSGREVHYIGGTEVLPPPLEGMRESEMINRLGTEYAEDAKKEWLMAALEDGVEINEPDDIEKYSGQFKLRIPKSLHKSLSEHSKKEGISMNQYCLYLLSKNDVLYSK